MLVKNVFCVKYELFKLKKLKMKNSINNQIMFEKARHGWEYYREGIMSKNC